MQIMADKVMKIPGPDHPISIEANPSRVVSRLAGSMRGGTSSTFVEMMKTLERKLRRIMGIGARGLFKRCGASNEGAADKAAPFLLRDKTHPDIGRPHARFPIWLWSVTGITVAPRALRQCDRTSDGWSTPGRMRES
jgi:hypothetical protein